MVLIGGVACTFDMNMVPEVIGKKLEPMLIVPSGTYSTMHMFATMKLGGFISYMNQWFSNTYNVNTSYYIFELKSMSTVLVFTIATCI